MKNIIKSFCFITILLILLAVFMYTVFPKNNISKYSLLDLLDYEILEEKDDTIDVLFVGDSLVYSSVSPMEIWKEHGFTSFDCSTPAQLLETSYKYIKIAIERQHPKVIFLEANVLFRDAKKRTFIRKIKDIKESKLVTKFKKNPFKFSIITLSIVYLIYLIAYYPGVVGYDPSYQIKEVLGIPNFYSESAGIVGTSLLTAYNPILHTLFIGYIFKLGLLLGSANIGIFIYTLIQMSFMIFVLSYSIKFLHQEKIPTVILLIILGLYIFIPIFPFYALSAFKDTYFALFMVLYIIELCKLIKYDYKKKDVIRLILISICLFFFRHNGILTIILSLPFFLLL